MAVSFVEGKRTRDFAFVSLCYGRSGEEICTGFAMAASGRMQYDYKQTNKLQDMYSSATLIINTAEPWPTSLRLVRDPVCKLDESLRAGQMVHRLAGTQNTTCRANIHFFTG